jgi:hypothetical protein
MFTALWTILVQVQQLIDVTAILLAARFTPARNRAPRFSLMMIRRAPSRTRHPARIPPQFDTNKEREPIYEQA